MKDKRYLFSLFFLCFFISSGLGQIQPNNIPNLLVWYDANDPSIAPGLVETWPDLSNNHYDLIQPNENNRAEKIENVIGTKSVLRFSGGQAYQLEFDQEYSNPGTVFVLFSNNIPVQFQTIIDGFSTKNQIRLTSALTYGFRTESGGTFKEVAFGRPRPFSHILTTNIINGENSKLRQNRIEVATGELFNNTFDGITIGRGFYIYSYDDLDGDIAEVIYYNRALTEEEIEQVEDYFYLKYAAPVDLSQSYSDYGFCDRILHAGTRFVSYLWSDGSIGESFQVPESGTYWVQTEDIFGRVSSDTIEVILPEMDYPITPNFCPGQGVTWNPGFNYSNLTYEWSTGSQNNQITINSEGDYHVVVTDSYGCKYYSDTIHFYEDPFPSTASLGGDADLCEGNRLFLTSGADVAVDYLWSTGETTPQIVINESGTYSCQVTSLSGCVANVSANINIIGTAPIIQFSAPEYACKNAEFNFDDFSYTNDATEIIGWSWDFGDTIFTNKNGAHTIDSAGLHEVSLQVETNLGCTNDTTFYIEIKDLPELGFTFSSLRCQFYDIEFYGGQISVDPITDWTWVFYDSTSQVETIQNGQEISHSFENPGEHVVFLIGKDIYGCIDTVSQIKSIDPAPVVSFDYNDACQGGVVHYTNNTTLVDTLSVNYYLWDFGDGTTSGQLNPSKPYANYGNYVTTLIVGASNNCVGQVSNLVKIHANPTVNFNVDQPCAGINTVFSDQSYVPNGSVANVSWSFNNGTPQNGFVINKNFQNGGSYNLRQIVNSAFGCSNSLETVVQIHDVIKADFTYSPTSFLADEPVYFQNKSIGANLYDWKFGESTTSSQENPIVVFDEGLIGDTIIIRLIAHNEHECYDTITKNATIYDGSIDLDLKKLFCSEKDGFLDIGVVLKNNGGIPINKIELTLQKPGIGMLKEIWEGELLGGAEETYVFKASPSASISVLDTAFNYLCVEGRVLESEISETNFENNELCISLSSNQMVMVRPFPNPVDDELNLRFIMPKGEKGSVYIYDLQGRMTYGIEDKVFDEGINDLKIYTTGWAVGKYTIKYIGESKVPIVGFMKK